jgi:uncharacterized RDD family membrane protein YckC
MSQPGGWQQPPVPPQGGWQQPPMPPQGGWVQNTQAGPAPGVVYGGFWIRLVAWIIDAIILGVVQGILAGALGQTTGQSISGLISIVYFIGMWGYNGQTIGMMPFNMRVVRNTDGGKITWVNAILRFIGLIVSFVAIFIGVIWVAFDSRKRGWHDMIGGTVVVRPVG